MFLVRGVTIFLLVLAANATAAISPIESFSDTLRHCLISQSHGTLGHCMGIGAISRLQSLDSSPEFDLVDGVTLTKDAQEYRDAHNFGDGDPSSFRSIMDSFTHVFSRRNLQWNMGFLYPGLAMRVAPSSHTAGTLEFVLDPHREALNVHSLKEAGTGRLLTRQFLLPFLLGFKFNMASLIPILFGILALVAKKALIISKVALVISSALALGSLLFNYGGNNYQQQHYDTGHFNPGFGGGIHGYKGYAEDEYAETFYRGMPEQQMTPDQLHLYGNIAKSFNKVENEKDVKGRNFAWSEAEKMEKEKSI